MNTKLLAAGLVLALLPTASFACDGHGDETAASTSPYGQVGLDEVAQLVTSKGAVIVDANKAERFAKGHIPGAIHTRADENGKLTGAALPADKTAKLVFYCHSEQCQASHMAAQAAVNAGHTNVFVYAGGIVGWEKAGKPTEKSAAPAAPAKGQG